MEDALPAISNSLEGHRISPVISGTLGKYSQVYLKARVLNQSMPEIEHPGILIQQLLHTPIALSA